MPAGMTAMTAPQTRAVDFDDLLDLDVAPANDAAPADDVERHAPALRIVPRWNLSATLAGDSEDGLYAGLDYDMTDGSGVFVATVDMPPIGARVDVTLTLANGETIETAGVVRWVRDADIASDGLPPGCGIECKCLPLAVVRTLQAMAAEREPLLWLPELS
jgi:Tfp pilus assembly protein PilZ